MDLNLFKTDVSKSSEGVWCPVDSNTALKIARFGNRVFQRALQYGMKPYQRLIDRDALDDATSDKILVTALVEGVLLDWRGMTKGGEPLPYSKSTAIAILLDKSLEDFRKIVVELSQDMQLFRDQEVVEAEEKLQNTSDGDVNGEIAKISSAA